MKKLKTATLVLSIFLIISALVSCNVNTDGKPDPWANATYTENISLGSGATTFDLIVEVLDNSVTFSINTDKTIVGDALQELNLIEGEEGAYGLYIKKVNGITADYDVDKTYWSFYIGDEYAMTGVDMTEISSGATYKLVYTK